MASKTYLKSNLGKVLHEIGEGMEELRDEWRDTAEDTAKSTLARKEAQRGYSLNTLYDGIEGENRANNGAAVVSDWPSGVPVPRFFEYGTVHIDPLPYLRPAKRKADKVLKDKAKRVMQAKADNARLRF